ncbi:Type II inositol 1,4,5-trisphosphate 5-phosphatase [Eumeta japonica]|uniref:Type II inositol 1,4,5-trisphosphate 5-phosphatase n=1 Tax=Eumeta variegata TaxID=151549 RepID=A0A4C1Y8Q2_EUMVA|nr:Type II inositol 1,4,5-trisphosphate 5-phosphatase [Eumeta japonica]
MSLEIIKSIVQEKFAVSEKVTAILPQAKVLYPEWEKKERFLAIVENGEEKAVFCLFSSCFPPKTFSDLSIEIILPIDKHFKCEIDNKPNDSDAVLYLNLLSRNNKLQFEIRMIHSNNFVDELFHAMETSNKSNTSQEFSWLQKYNVNKKDEDDQLYSSSIILARQNVTINGRAPERESKIKIEMLMKESQYIYTKTFSIFTATWNTGREDEWSDAVLAGVDNRDTYVKVGQVRLVAAHVEEYERRNQDYRDICSRTQFSRPYQPPRGIKDHDQIYWLGDLNYRITERDPATVKKLLDENNIASVLEWDQLKRQHTLKQVFAGYSEGIITFKPTYKYDPGTDNWDSSEKNRAPAWCDRIFWKGENITQLAYRSHPSLNISDHKPVSATFHSEIKIIDQEKYRKVYEDVIKKLDKIENELIPQVMVDQTEIDFGTVKYLELQIRTMTIANTGQVRVDFEFINKLDETSFCKEWLIVEPYKKSINPGEKCDIQLKMLVNKNSAPKMNSGSDQLYDILVLHVYRGKDIFITVTGNYEKSCFGTSIEVLVNLNVPIKEVSFVKLIELESKRDQCVSNSSTYAIPKEIWHLVDHIYLHGLKEPSLFDQPGLHSEVLLIRDWLDSGSIDPIPGSIHSVAEALLLLLASTADPIIPYNLQLVCLSASSNYLQCKQIVMQLPEFRRNVFLYLCQFLQEALQYSSENGLDAKSLSALFGSIFLRDIPNQTQMETMTRISKQTIDKKKAHFVYHFLVNDHSDLIFSK